MAMRKLFNFVISGDSENDLHSIQIAPGSTLD